MKLIKFLSDILGLSGWILLFYIDWEIALGVALVLVSLVLKFLMRKEDLEKNIKKQ
ncbi:MAG: hypothetical protein WC778_11070 [Negativicutes bacterium]|jgi:hypothetical protein